MQNVPSYIFARKLEDSFSSFDQMAAVVNDLNWKLFINGLLLDVEHQFVVILGLRSHKATEIRTISRVRCLIVSLKSDEKFAHQIKTSQIINKHFKTIGPGQTLL